MAYIVDGNNFLGFAHPGQHRDPENRMALVRKLLAFRRHSGARVILVFDGRLSDELAALAAGEEKFRVLQPPEGESADDVIRTLIDRQKDRRRLFVVSSDREVRSYAREAGAQPLACRDFAMQLKGALKERKSLREMDKPEPRASAMELGLWLELFGERRK
jgi:predicted RNA-binding protein with PIN domain